MRIRGVQQLVPQLIQRAAEMLGGTYALATFLGVEEHAVRFWGRGRANAPDAVIFSLVDLVLKDDMARAQGDRRQAVREMRAHSPSTRIGSINRRP